MLPNISRKKSNQTIKFGPLMEYNKRDIFSGNHAEIEAGGLVPNLFLLLKKVLYEIKASGLQISFNIFR